MKTSSLLIALFALVCTVMPDLGQAQGLTSVAREEFLSPPVSLLENPDMADERAYVEPGMSGVLRPSSPAISRTEPSFGQAAFAQTSSESQAPPGQAPSADNTSKEKDLELTYDEPPIPDPFEPINRAVFVFNDGFYFCFLKPVTLGYKAVVSEPFRIGFRNAFYNLTSPIHIFNCMFQGKFRGAGNETARFFINTTFGLLGFFDQAKDKFGIDKCDEDLGQTLGAWGSGPGFYIEWPFFGSSTLRDTAGFVGDMAFDPRTYIFNPVVYFIRPIEIINETSFRIGDYEALKKAALDPYVAKKEAYHQYRLTKIKE